MRLTQQHLHLQAPPPPFGLCLRHLSATISVTTVIILVHMKSPSQPRAWSDQLYEGTIETAARRACWDCSDAEWPALKHGVKNSPIWYR